MSKLYLSWQDVEELVIDLSNHLQPTPTSKTPTLIVGVARGGLIPATLLSYHIYAPVVSLPVSTRHEQTTTWQLVDTIASWPANQIIDDIVVVDDICDSGRTFDIIKFYLPRARYITLCNKQSTKQQAYAPRMVDDNEWVVFPWERN